MTNYGPPGGGVPGPWRGQRPDETSGRPVQQPYPPAQQPYPPVPETYPPSVQAYPPGVQGRPGSYGDGSYGGAPVGPYGGGPGSSYGGGSYRPTQAAPAYGGEPYRPNGPYGGDPSPTPGRRGRGPLIAVLAIVLLLVVAGGGAFWFLSGPDDPAPSTAPTGSAVAAEPSADATAPAEPAPSAAAPESSADPRFVKVGQCVRNDGAAGGKPKLLISGCAPKSYEVLHRIDGATNGEPDAEAKCAKVEGYTNWYFFDSELDTLDFVLCLKQR